MSRADEAAARAGYRVLPDATGVAAYYVDLANVTDRPDWTLASVAHHELLPGHMAQHALQVAARPHALRLRYAGAFFEGWANYAQHLAQELGAFDGDPRGEIGMLQWLMFRIGRAVIDTGIHARGWSRARAIQAMTALQGQSIAFISIEADIDRMIINPGQLAAEGLATLDLIVMGKAAGPGGLVAFHRAILQNGPWPIGLLPEISAAKY